MTPPLGFFDPLGLSKFDDPEALKSISQASGVSHALVLVSAEELRVGQEFRVCRIKQLEGIEVP